MKKQYFELWTYMAMENVQQIADAAKKSLNLPKS